MPLSNDVLGEIDSFVRGGFEDRDRIIEIVAEELYEPGELSAEEVEAAVDAALFAHEKQKASWPPVTDCDKLDSVFASLSSKGVIALQYAGYTQSDGYEDITQAYQDHPNKESVIGYCFYHGQDLARAVEGGGLCLAFGPMDPKKEATEGPRIGALIADALKQVGFNVRWNGTFDERIFVPDVDWKRR